MGSLSDYGRLMTTVLYCWKQWIQWGTRFQSPLRRSSSLKSVQHARVWNLYSIVLYDDAGYGLWVNADGTPTRSPRPFLALHMQWKCVCGCQIFSGENPTQTPIRPFLAPQMQWKRIRGCQIFKIFRGRTPSVHLWFSRCKENALSAVGFMKFS